MRIVLVLVLLLAIPFVSAQSLADVLDRGSFLVLDILSNPWVLSLIVFLVLLMLFYYLFLVGLSFVKTFQDDDPFGNSRFGYAKKIALLLAIISTIGLLGFVGYDGGTFSPLYVQERVSTILSTFGMMGTWFLAVLLGSITYFAGVKAQEGMDEGIPFLRKFGLPLLTFGLALWLGSSINNNQDAAGLGSTLALFGLIMMLIPKTPLPSVTRGSQGPPGAPGAPGAPGSPGVTPEPFVPEAPTETTPEEPSSPMQPEDMRDQDTPGEDPKRPEEGSDARDSLLSLPSPEKTKHIEQDERKLLEDTRIIGVWDEIVERGINQQIEIIEQTILPSIERIKNLVAKNSLTDHDISGAMKQLAAIRKECLKLEKSYTFRRVYRIERKIAKHVRNVEHTVNARLEEIHARINQPITEDERTILKASREHLQDEITYANKIYELAIDIQRIFKEDLPSLRKQIGFRNDDEIVARIEKFLSTYLKRSKHEDYVTLHSDVVSDIHKLFDKLKQWEISKVAMLKKVLEYSEYLYQIDAHIQAAEKNSGKAGELLHQVRTPMEPPKKKKQPPKALPPPDYLQTLSVTVLNEVKKLQKMDLDKETNEFVNGLKEYFTNRVMKRTPERLVQDMQSYHRYIVETETRLMNAHAPKEIRNAIEKISRAYSTYKKHTNA
jgi:hypothetical protein